MSATWSEWRAAEAALAEASRAAEGARPRGGGRCAMPSKSLTRWLRRPARRRRWRRCAIGCATPNGWARAPERGIDRNRRGRRGSRRGLPGRTGCWHGGRISPAACSTARSRRSTARPRRRRRRAPRSSAASASWKPIPAGWMRRRSACSPSGRSPASTAWSPTTCRSFVSRRRASSMRSPAPRPPSRSCGPGPTRRAPATQRRRGRSQRRAGPAARCVSTGR